MQNAVAIIEQGALIQLNSKGAQGTFARAIAFASRDTRMAMGQALYAKWLANGQYRPIISDVLTCGLVPKAAVPFVSAMVPVNGAVPKDRFIDFCAAVVDAIESKGKEVKGQKLFVLEIARRVAAMKGAEVEGELRRVA